MINRNINTNYCLTKTSVNNQNKHSFSLKHVFKNPFPSIKYRCTTTNEIENIIMSFKSSNSFGYDDVPTGILKLCSHFISCSLNYMCNKTLLIGVFTDRLKYAFITPVFKKDNKNDIKLQVNINFNLVFKNF